MTPEQPPLILIVDDDETLLWTLNRQLSRNGYRVVTATTGRDALQALAAQPISVALVDYGLPDTNGIKLTRRIAQAHPEVGVIAITGRGNAEIASLMLKAGAVMYFEKPIADPKHFFETVHTTLAVRELAQSEAELRELLRGSADAPGEGLDRLIGQSRAIRELKAMLLRLRDLPREFPVLLLGESGVGKTFAAKAFHDLCGRSGTMANLNAKSLEAEFERQLFGNVRFTGVSQDIGWCQRVGTGTLFIDEIGELSLENQAKLLKLVEEREFQRYGGHSTETFEGRLVLATNRNLEEAVRDGSFRKDLWFRINTWNTRIPPLRDRPGDIPVLSYYFVNSYNKRLNRDVQRITRDAFDLLQRHAWPGNVRELENVIKKAVGLLFRGTEITADLLSRSGFSPQMQPALPEASVPVGRPPVLQRPLAPSDPPRPAEDLLLAFSAEDLLALDYQEAKKQVVDAFSKAYLSNRLGDAAGNITEAARQSGMLRPNFSKLMKRFGVARPGSAGRTAASSNEETQLRTEEQAGTPAP